MNEQYSPVSSDDVDMSGFEMPESVFTTEETDDESEPDYYQTLLEFFGAEALDRVLNPYMGKKISTDSQLQWQLRNDPQLLVRLSQAIIRSYEKETDQPGKSFLQASPEKYGHVEFNRKTVERLKAIALDLTYPLFYTHAVDVNTALAFAHDQVVSLRRVEQFLRIELVKGNGSEERNRVGFGGFAKLTNAAAEYVVGTKRIELGEDLIDELQHNPTRDSVVAYAISTTTFFAHEAAHGHQSFYYPELIGLTSPLIDIIEESQPQISDYPNNYEQYERDFSNWAKEFYHRLPQELEPYQLMESVREVKTQLWQLISPIGEELVNLVDAQKAGPLTESDSRRLLELAKKLDVIVTSPKRMMLGDQVIDYTIHPLEVVAVCRRAGETVAFSKRDCVQLITAIKQQSETGNVISWPLPPAANESIKPVTKQSSTETSRAEKPVRKGFAKVLQRLLGRS